METETHQMITRAIDYIKSNCTAPITVADVACRIGFSSDYFNRLFRAHTGFNVMEYVRFLRLSRAARLLRCTDREVTDIAFECGYETHESFTRAFGAMYGLSPSEYRLHFENLPMTYADVADHTGGARFLHSHPTFRKVDNADVTAELLRTDAIRHGFEAVVVYTYNGTEFFTDMPDNPSAADTSLDDTPIADTSPADTSTADTSAGIYIAIDTFGSLICADVVPVDTSADLLNTRPELAQKTAEYIKLLRGFAGAISFSLPGEVRDVVETMQAYGVTAKADSYEYLCRGGKLPVETHYTLRRLTVDDIPTVEAFAREYGHDWKVVESLTQRDVYHNVMHDEPLGIFDGDTLAAIFRTCVYERYGFRVGELEGAAVLKQYRGADFTNTAYKLAINHLIDADYLPFCTLAETEDFIPADNGFDLTKIVYAAE